MTNQLLAELEMANRKINKLQERIDKAIEYIKENATFDEEYKVFCDDLRYDDCLDLLNILQGE